MRITKLPLIGILVIQENEVKLNTVNFFSFLFFYCLQFCFYLSDILIDLWFNRASFFSSEKFLIHIVKQKYRQQILNLLTCSTFCPFTTYSFPTFTLGWRRPLMRSAELTPIRYEALSAPGDQTVETSQTCFQIKWLFLCQMSHYWLSLSVPSASACSSRCFCLNFMLPKCMMAPTIL